MTIKKLLTSKTLKQNPAVSRARLGRAKRVLEVLARVGGESRSDYRLVGPFESGQQKQFNTQLVGKPMQRGTWTQAGSAPRSSTGPG